MKATINEWLRYEPELGVFFWRKSLKNGTKADDVAGGLDGDGYVVIRLSGRLWRANRLAWLVTHGEIPAGLDIDHINGDRSDDRITNLRAVTRSENNQNQRRARKDNKTGMLGVAFHKHSGLFNARIKLSGKSKSLGYFKTPEEAHAAYVQCKRETHSTNTL
jgi:hypothetical protein